MDFPGLFGLRNAGAEERTVGVVLANGARVSADGRTSPWMIQFQAPVEGATGLPSAARSGVAARKMAVASGWSVEMEPWKGGARAALALTFDDGYKSHTEVLAPLLRRKGFNATFYVITAGLGRSGKPAAGRYGDWEAFDTLVGQGFEVGSHTYSHKSLASLPLGDSATSGTLRFELAVSRRALLTYLSRLPMPFTLGYPYQENSQQVREEVAKMYLAARADGPFTKPEDLKFMALPGLGLVIPDNSDSSVYRQKFDSLARWVDDCLLETGGFQSLVLHEVLPYSKIQEAEAEGSAGVVSLDAFELFLDRLRPKVDSGHLWVGTIRDVVRYQMTWQATTMEARVTGDTLVIESRTNREIPGGATRLSLKVQGPPEFQLQSRESGALVPVQDRTSTSGKSFILEHSPGTTQKYLLVDMDPG